MSRTWGIGEMPDGEIPPCAEEKGELPGDLDTLLEAVAVMMGEEFAEALEARVRRARDEGKMDGWAGSRREFENELAWAGGECVW